MKILCICTPVPVVIECREKSTFIYTSKFVVNLNHEVSQEVSLEPCPYPSYRRRVIFLMCHVMIWGRMEFLKTFGSLGEEIII